MRRRNPILLQRGGIVRERPFLLQETPFIQKRRRSGQPAPDRERAPILHGINSPQMDQCTVHTSCFVAHKDHSMRIAYIAGGKQNFIPGGIAETSKLFSITKGDPLFIQRKFLLGNGKESPFVSSTLNGINHKPYTCSEDMDHDYIYYGISDDKSQHGEVSTNRMKITVQLSKHGTVVNNGPDRLKGGDLVRRGFPYFNKNSSQRGEIEPNLEWINHHVSSIHPDNYKVMMQLRKVTPSYITDIYRDIFYKLFNDSEDLAQRERGTRYYPTERHMNPETEGNRRSILTTLDRASVSCYHNMCIVGMQFLRTLMDQGLITGVADAAAGEEYNWEEAGINPNDIQVRKFAFMQRIAGQIGFFKTEAYKTAYPENDEANRQRESNTIQMFLTRYFHPWTPQDMKSRNRAILIDEAGGRYHNHFVNLLLEGSKIGKHEINSVLSHRMRSIVGMISKGGPPGSQVDGNFGLRHIY